MRTPSKSPDLLRARRGVTLIEALVAMLVMSLGLLAFAGLHSKLRLNSDVARQRSEAVRKAQEDMEDLRAFANLTAYGAIASTQQTQAVLATENATYAITRTVDTSTTPLMKRLTVAYAWTDRASNPQGVTIRSTIARLDPKLGAQMALPPNGSPVKDPLGRDVQIPIPAKNLGNGTSVYKPTQGGSVAFVFDNQTGRVVRKCTALSPSTTTANISAGTVADGASGCTNVNGLLLSGYVRFSLTNSPNPSTPNDVPVGPLSIAVAFDSSSPPSGSAPLGRLERLNSTYWTPTAPPSSGYTAADCGAEDSKTVSFVQDVVDFTQTNNGQTQTITSVTAVVIVPAATAITADAIAPYAGLSSSVISNPVDTGERYVAYACAVYPVDQSGTLAWTGRSTIVPSGWQLGTLTGSWPNTTNASDRRYKVCRYSNDANRNGYVWSPNVQPSTNATTTMTAIDNAEHPNAYIRVTTSLSNQNFLVIRGTEACPTDGAVEVDGQGSENYTDETTVLHQAS